MADPTDPPIDPSVIAQHTAAVEADTAALQENSAAARSVAEVTGSVQRQMSSITGVLNNVGTVLDKFTNSYENARSNLNNGFFSQNDARNISLVTTALLGVRDTAQQFSGLHFDSGGLLSPINDMSAALKEGGGLLDKMAGNVLAAFGRIMPESAKVGSAAIVTFGLNLLKSADNAIHMRDAVIQLAASSGNLNRIFTAAGPNLENLNEIMSQQSDELSNVAHTMNISRADAVKYYTEIGRIPGALTATLPASDQLFRSMDDSVANSSGKIDLFTGALATAKGTGRDFGDIVRDLSTAFKDYGLTGEAALNFSVNMSEISNNLGVDLQSVQSALNGGAEAFKRFADAGDSSARMAQGLATLTNEYAQALKNQGFSANQALEVAQNMTNEIGKMSIAQKAFLSSQTGGPGGLMGAFQLEKDLREGKITEVFQKVRDQMKKQLGGIVTLDDAAKNPGAAAQLARQITILQKGPLGSVARTDQEAYRILEAFKGGDKAIKQMAPDALKGAMDKGVMLQDQSRTLLSEIRADTERQLALTDQTNLLLAQQLTAATGSQRGGEGPAQELYRDTLKQARANAAQRAEQLTERTGTAIGTGARTGVGVDLGINTTTEGFTQNTSKIINAMTVGKEKIMSTLQMAMEKEINDTQSKIGIESNPEIKASLQKKLGELIQKKNVTVQNMLLNDRSEQTATSGSALSTTVNAAINNPTTAPHSLAGTTNAVAARPVNYANPTVGSLGDINVHVTGYCLRCKQEIEGGDQVSALSPAARRTSP